MAMFNPNAPQDEIPPEIVAQILALSASKDKSGDLDRQLRLSEGLLGEAFQQQNVAPASTAGGLVHVLGKGLAGYGGGMMYKQNRDDMQALRAGQVGARGSYLNLLNQKPGGAPQEAYYPSTFGSNTEIY